MPNGPNPLEGIELRAGAGTVLFMGLFALALDAGWIAGAWALSNEPSTAGWIALCAAGVPVALLFNWVAAAMLLGRVRFTDCEITETGVFSVKRVPWADVAGYWPGADPKASPLALVDAQGRKLITLGPYLDGLPEVAQRLAAVLPDFKARELAGELSEAAREAELAGYDAADRMRAARMWARAINVASCVICVPGAVLFFVDGPPELTLLTCAALAAMPLAGLPAVAVFPDALRLVQWRGSKLPTVTATLFTGLVLALIALKDEVLDFEAAGWWIGAAMAVQLAASFVFDRGVRRRPVLLLILAFFAAFTAVGAVLAANSLLDMEQARAEAVKVLGAEAKRGSGKDPRMHYRVKVRRADGSQETIEVSEAHFEQVRHWRRAHLLVRPGALGIAWVRHDEAFAP